MRCAIALVEEIKIAIGGISHNKLDEEIKAVALACKSDLTNGGVNVLIDTDPFLKQAVKLYARWYFNFQGAGDTWFEAYKGLNNSMCLSGEYNAQQ